MAPTWRRIAAATDSGAVPPPVAPDSTGHGTSAVPNRDSRSTSYSGTGAANRIPAVAQPVSIDPGSTSVTRMPNPATSAASAPLKPSRPHLAAL